MKGVKDQHQIKKSNNHKHFLGKKRKRRERKKKTHNYKKNIPKMGLNDQTKG